jgi:Mg2+ and Co2+ transporter CorA
MVRVVESVEDYQDLASGALALMVVSATALWAYFKRKDWL